MAKTEKKSDPTSLPYDATLKAMGSLCPRDFLRVFDQAPTGPVKTLSADLSTVTSAADLVIGLGDPLTGIVHMDFQAGPDEKKPLDVMVYNALLHRQYGVPVESTLFLLHEKAHLTSITGEVNYSLRPTGSMMNFRYKVVYLWDVSAQELLEGPLGVAALAVLGEFPEGVEDATALRDIVHRLVARLDGEATPDMAGKLLTSAYVLTGLRVKRGVANSIFQGARAMRESDTFQAILQEGREEGLTKGITQGLTQGTANTFRQCILKVVLGRDWKVTSANRKKLEAITDVGRLERMFDLAGSVKSWSELFAIE